MISTHSAREDGDAISSNNILFFTISTHSAREDGDFTRRVAIEMSQVFQPTPPARTETMSLQVFETVFVFQPTPPARTETMRQVFAGLVIYISTHSAREDGDFIIHLKND